MHHEYPLEIILWEMQNKDKCETNKGEHSIRLGGS